MYVKAVKQAIKHGHDMYWLYLPARYKLADLHSHKVMER